MLHDESLKPSSSLADGQFIIDKLIAKGGFSFIYEGRIIYKLALTNELVAISAKEDPVVIKELYISDKSRREVDGFTLKWNDENEPDEEARLSTRIKHKTKNEATKLRLLSSPHILKIIGAIEENNTIYQITQKIEGAIDFHKRLQLSTEKKGEKLSVSDAVRYITQISEALKEVHSKNIVHLDIKPENILCDYKDDAILIDFGISMTIGEKAGQSTLLSAASRPWAPPEQYNIKDTNAISFATDIYSLGQTFYAFLTGVVPPDFTNITSGSEILQSPSEYNKEVTDYLDEVITKCIQIRRDKRYQTIEEFIFALQGEQDYKKIIKKAQEANQNNDFEQAIHLLNESQKYIPLSSNLLELRLDSQNKLKQQQKEGEYKQKEKEAQQLIENGDFAKALGILELLPINNSVQKQIDFCKHGINQRKKEEYIEEAETFIANKDFSSALNKYQEAKKIDQKDIEIDKKIDELQNVLSNIEKNKKYNRFFQDGNEYFALGQYENALNAYLLAKENATISTIAIDRKIKECSDKIDYIKRQDTDKQELLDALNNLNQSLSFDSITTECIDEELEILESKKDLFTKFKLKYPSDASFNAAIDALVQQEDELKNLKLYFNAEEALSDNRFEDATNLLNLVTSGKIITKVNALKKKIEEAKDDAEDRANINYARMAEEEGRYDDALTYLKKIKAAVKYEVSTKKKAIEAKQARDKEDLLEKTIKNQIEENKFTDAEKTLSNILSPILKQKYRIVLDQQKINLAHFYIEKGELDTAHNLLSEVDSEVARLLKTEVEKKRKQRQEEGIIAETQTLVNSGSLDRAKTILLNVDTKSDQHSQATQLLFEIEAKKNNAIFTKAEKAFGAGKYDEAISLLKKIPHNSEHYTESKRLINESENKLKEALYEKMVADVQKLVRAKKYAKAKKELAKIPIGTTVEPQRQELLTLLQKLKKINIKNLTVIIVFIILPLFFYVVSLFTLREPNSNPTPQTPTTDSSVVTAPISEDVNQISTPIATVKEDAETKASEEKEKIEAENKAKREAQLKKEQEERTRKDKEEKENSLKIEQLERQAHQNKSSDNYVAAIQKMKQAQNIRYSSARNTTINNWEREGDEKARDIMKRAIKLKIDGNLDPCNASLKAYYAKVRKLTANSQILAMIKCNE